jgi:hypothetical protein
VKPAAHVPAPVVIAYRLEAVSALAQELSELQAYFNAKLLPPAGWQTVWVDECSNLYELTAGKGAYLPRG